MSGSRSNIGGSWFPCCGLWNRYCSCLQPVITVTLSSRLGSVPIMIQLVVDPGSSEWIRLIILMVLSGSGSISSWFQVVPGGSQSIFWWIRVDPGQYSGGSGWIPVNILVDPGGSQSKLTPTRPPTRSLFRNWWIRVKVLHACRT